MLSVAVCGRVWDYYIFTVLFTFEFPANDEVEFCLKLNCSQTLYLDSTFILNVKHENIKWKFIHISQYISD